MYGVTFGSRHSYADFGLWLTEVDISQPQPRRHTVSVPGRDGIIDMTTVLTGETKYEIRTLTLTFKCRQDAGSWDSAIEILNSAIHGKRLNVILDNDPNYYWDAYVYVDSRKSDRTVGTIVVKCEAQPYKLKNYLTSQSKTVSGSGTMSLVNSRMRVIPYVTTTAQITITKGSTSVTFAQGTDLQNTSFMLEEGTTSVTITGTATVTIKYREGAL